MDSTRMLSSATGTTLPALAEAAWERFGDSATVVFEGARILSGDLGNQARRAASGLAELGFRPGDRAVVCMANCPEVFVTYHAVWRVGGVVTPVLFLLSEDELRHILIDSGATVAVTTPEFLPKLAAAAAGVPTVRAVICTGAAPGVVPFSQLLSRCEAGLPAAAPEDLAALLYTGGTTGRSKGVMLSHDAMSAAAWSATVAGADDVLTTSLLPLPLAHAYGLMVSTMALHAIEPATTVLMRWFEPTAWLTLAAAERVQIAAAVPAMLRLLAACPLPDYDLSSLRRVVSGSAPLPASVRQSLERSLPHVEFVEGYGCTETAALISTTPSGGARAGSVGQVAGGMALRIERVDGTLAAPGEDGEVCVSGPNLMTAYWHSPEDTASALVDGWFHTGDVGHVDVDGYLYIVDRMKDVIIRGGFNVYPRDVEDALRESPDVADCAVIGRADDVHGEEVMAFVVLSPDSTASADDIRAFGRARLSAVKYPRDVVLVDTVPLTSIGKVDRKALRRRQVAAAQPVD